MDFCKFSFMVDCLKELNYPNVYSMDDSEIKDIFSRNNRQFLVSWMLKQLDEDYNEIVEKASNEELAEIVCCNGFCTNAMKEKFISGTGDTSNQFIILYKMFNQIKNTTKIKTTDEPYSNVTIEEIDELIQFDTNLFPTCGPKQTLSSSDIEKKIKEYSEEIDNIKAALNSDNQAGTYMIDNSLKEQLISSLKKLELSCPEFTRQALNLSGNATVDGVDKTVFGEDFEEILATCSTDLKIILEFMRNTNAVLNFKDDTKNKSGQDNKNFQMIRRIADLCNEISAMKKGSDYGCIL